MPASCSSLSPPTPRSADARSCTTSFPTPPCPWDRSRSSRRVLATLVSLYYYLGIVRALYMRRTEDLQLAPIGGSPPRDALLQGAVLTCLIVTVGSFFAVQPLIDLARHAASSLSF